ncbi:MAG: hypothetical protein QXV17_08285 [Candidatus Micrarchaeaceae archaeon]
MSGIYGATASYAPLLLSHQTGLSVTTNGANDLTLVGTSITVPRNGILLVCAFGHVSAGAGFVQLQLTRNSVVYSYGNNAVSLFGNTKTSVGESSILTTTSQPLLALGDFNATTSNFGSGLNYYFKIPVYSGDVINIYLSNNSSSGDITYLDDIVVMLL